MAASDKPAEPTLLLDVVAVAKLLDVSTRHLWRMCDAGTFPRPISVGRKLKRWSRATVAAWVEAQARPSSR